MGLPRVLLSVIWIFAPVVCGGVACSSLKHLDNGQTFFRYGGLLVIFRCNPGYRLHGYKSSSCLSGHWSRNPPVCVGSGCPDPGPLMHGAGRVNQDGSWAVFSCSSGFRLHGPSMLYCKGHGNWNGTKPVCREWDKNVDVLKDLTDSQHPPTTRDQQDAYTSAFPKVEDHKYDPVLHILSPIDGDKIRAYLDTQVQTTQETWKAGSTIRMSDDKKEKTDPSQMKLFKDSAFILSTISALLSPQAPGVLSSSDITTSINHTNFDETVEGLQELTTFPEKASIWGTAATTDKVKSMEAKTRPYDMKEPTSGLYPDPLVLSTSSFTSSSAVLASTNPLSTSTVKPDLYLNTITRSTRIGDLITKKSYSKRPLCPDPERPAHGTFHYRNVKPSTSSESDLYIQYSCDPGYTLAHGEIQRVCQQEETWSGTTPACVDVDECMLPAAITTCMFGCINTPGSFHCRCPSGYNYNSAESYCQDLDECTPNGGLGPCEHQCHNSPGSYRCSCKYGFTLASGGHGCVAECPAGFRKQLSAPLKNSTSETLKKECVDINECLENTCEWKCVNLPGSYRCICPRGYTLQRDGQHCKDINECSRQNGGCSHVCVNRKGGYKCACPASHRLSTFNWKKCSPRATTNSTS